jgi:hypothetical protein
VPQEDVREELHQAILDLLFEKVRGDTFPSTTVLDMIEQRLRPEDVQEYTEILLEKARSDTYPSFDHLRRLAQFA